MVKELKQIEYGLRPLPKDNRDFDYEKVFGAIKELPIEDFMVAEPLKIENQGNTDFCTAYASTSVSEDQEGIDLDPLYTFAKTKKIEGNYKGWGADLRTACKAHVKYGALKKEDSPYDLKNMSRDEIANWENWPEELDEKAVKHAKESYFKINTHKDAFDAFRATLYANKSDKRSILTGVLWRNGWINAKGGIIDHTFSPAMYGHAIKISGQKTIDGKLYLVGVLSNGTEIGDNGLFYFSREVVNNDFTFGAYCFIDMDPKEAKKVAWSFWRKLLETIKKIINL